MTQAVRDMSFEQRRAAETLLGRPVRDDEYVSIHSSSWLKDAPSGGERARLLEQYQKHLDTLADRVRNVPEDELMDAIERAVDYARHHAG